MTDRGEQSEQRILEQLDGAFISDEQLDQRLASLAEKVDVHDNLVEHYSANSAQIYSTGNNRIDQAYRAGMNKEKGATLGRLLDKIEELDKLKVGEVAFSEGLDLNPDPVNRQFRRIKRRGKTQASAWHSDSNWLGIEQRDELDRIERSADSGVYRSMVLYDISFCNLLNYHISHRGKEGFNEDPLLEISEISPSEDLVPFKDLLTPEESATGKLTLGALSERMQSKGLLDLSLENLAARHHNFRAVAQIEIANLMLDDILCLFRGTSSMQRRALGMFKEFKPHLFDDDFGNKIQMQAEIASVLKQYASQETHPSAKKFLNALGERSTKTAEYFLGYSDRHLMDTYGHLGFDVPAVLLPEIKKPVPIESVDNTEPNTTEQEQLYSEASEWNGQLKDRLEQLCAPWRMSAKKRKQAGFGNFERQLINGATDFLGKPLLKPMLQDDARATIDILYRLRILASRPSLVEGQQELDASLISLRELQEDSTLLQLFIAENDIKGLAVEQTNVLPTIEKVKEEWGDFSRLIRQEWPNFEGAVAARQLEQLLFNIGSQTEHKEATPLDTPSQKEDILSIEANIMKQLDKIILPPNATFEDLEKELQRVGANKTTIKRIEWERIHGLIDIRDLFGGELYRSKDNSLKTSHPYFVAVITHEGEKYAIAESPSFGNATYIVAEKHAPGTWLEVLELSKRDAKSIGASKLVHKQGSSPDEHTERIYNKILELHMIEGLS